MREMFVEIIFFYFIGEISKMFEKWKMREGSTMPKDDEVTCQDEEVKGEDGKDFFFNFLT